MTACARGCAWEGVEGRCDGTAHADEKLCAVRARRFLHACRAFACCREALDERRMLSCSAVLCDVMRVSGAAAAAERATRPLTDAHRSSSRALQLKRLRRVPFSLQDFVFCVWCFFISGRRRNRRRLAGATFVAMRVGVENAVPRGRLAAVRGTDGRVGRHHKFVRISTA